MEARLKVLGIDLGSREVKIKVTENGYEIYKNKMGTMNFYRDYCIQGNNVKLNREKLGIGATDVSISTGYGRNNLALSGFTAINEIKAHVYGVIKKTEMENFILLDMGGQDVKVVKVEKGIITDMNLNDKCAASCGRYLESMAAVLETGLDVLSEYYMDPAVLNSTCSVFSESELIGKIAEGVSFEKLCAGVNYSLYNKIKPMLTEFRGMKLILSGGVAKSKAIKYYLSNDYNKIIETEDPQFNGAEGCCYYGERMGK